MSKYDDEALELIELVAENSHHHAAKSFGGKRAPSTGCKSRRDRHVITCNLKMIKHDYSCNLRHKTLHLCACYHTLSAFLSFHANLCYNLKIH